jgi:ABC-type nitrate/sulfonate/bicarbonate transport system substrate-binding protein
LGIAGWDTGAAQQAEVIMKDLWGLDIKKDFTVSVSPWPVGPQLLAKGDLDMIINSVPVTMDLWMSGKIRPIFNTVGHEWAKHKGGHKLSFNFLCMWKDFLDKNMDVAQNLLSAYKEGLYYTHAHTENWIREYLPLQVKNPSEEQIRFMTRHYFEYEYLYHDPHLDEDFVDGEMDFLKLAESMGVLKKGMATKKIFQVVK